jgi:hypothetical protein
MRVSNTSLLQLAILLEVSILKVDEREPTFAF